MCSLSAALNINYRGTLQLDISSFTLYLKQHAATSKSRRSLWCCRKKEPQPSTKNQGNFLELCFIHLLSREVWSRSQEVQTCCLYFSKATSVWYWRGCIMRRNQEKITAKKASSFSCQSRPLASMSLCNAEGMLEQLFRTLEGKWVNIFPLNNACKNEWKSKILLWPDLLRRLSNSSTATVWKEDNANQCVCLLTHTYVSKHCLSHDQKLYTKKCDKTHIFTKIATLLHHSTPQIRPLLIGPVPLQQSPNYKFWSKSKTKSNQYQNMQDTKEGHVKQTLHRWGQQHGVQPGWCLSSRGTSRRTKQG